MTFDRAVEIRDENYRRWQAWLARVKQQEAAEAKLAKQPGNEGQFIPFDPA